MKQFQLLARVNKNIEVCPGIYCLTFTSKEMAQEARPGQFLMLKVSCPPMIDPVLRRPFSIHKVEGDQVSILFKVVGRGTEILAREKHEIDLLGPLGNGYTIPEKGSLALVGGGLGIAPLLFLAQYCMKLRKNERTLILLGARTAIELTAVNDFRKLGFPIELATDDGSAGHHGFVPHLMTEKMEGADWSVVTCGPQPMMRGVAEQSAAKGWECQLSLETVMACGIGACLGCAVRAKNNDSYLHVCKDGPVFDAAEVIL